MLSLCGFIKSCRNSCNKVMPSYTARKFPLKSCQFQFLPSFPFVSEALYVRQFFVMTEAKISNRTIVPLQPLTFMTTVKHVAP